jgi:TPR repeat protein
MKLQSLIFAAALMFAGTAAPQDYMLSLTSQRVGELEDAISKGDPFVSVYLGQLLWGGVLVDGQKVLDKPRGERLVKGAIPALELAAERGEPLAMFHLAVVYDKGLTVKQDRRKGQGYMKRAAELGLTSAQREYALSITLLASETRTVKDEDWIQRCAWMSISAENGNAMARQYVNEGKVCEGLPPIEVAATVAALKTKHPELMAHPLQSDRKQTPFVPREK